MNWAILKLRSRYQAVHTALTFWQMTIFSSSLQILRVVPGYDDSGDNNNIGPYFSGRLTAMFNTT